MLATKPDVDAEVLAAILNSAVSSLFIEVSARANLGDGAIKLSQKPNDARELLVFNPRTLNKRDASAILSSFSKIAARDVESWIVEIQLEGPHGFGLGDSRSDGTQTKNDFEENLRGAWYEMIKERLSLADTTQDSSQEHGWSATPRQILTEVIGEILPDGAPRFPEAFWPQGFNGRKPDAFKEINVTGKRLRLGHAMLTQQEVVDHGGPSHHVSVASRGGIPDLRRQAQPLCPSGANGQICPRKNGRRL